VRRNLARQLKAGGRSNRIPPRVLTEAFRLMPASQFLAQFGFTEDPFQSTNAGDEPLLEHYFVPPPYFASVLGDTSRPKSNVVLAPRGGGKTAQRVMIEKHSNSDPSFMCITYDTFDLPEGFKPEDATWAYHIAQVNRLLLMAILVTLETSDASIDSLTEQQKRFLKFGIERYLGTLSAADFQIAVDSLKNFGDRARDLWKQYGGVVAVIVTAAMHKFGLGDLRLPADMIKSLDESLRYQFKMFLGIITTLGFKSTYVLVDRVDELSVTSKNAEAVETFIDALITDLPTLEEQTIAFKFFLWDQIESSYLARGARADRVPIFKLNWQIGELSRMLSERLKAYSREAIKSINDLLCRDIDIDLHMLVCYFATGSPRDMIRICQAIVAEQTRMRVDDPCVTRIDMARSPSVQQHALLRVI